MTERDNNLVEDFVSGADPEFKMPSMPSQASFLPSYSVPVEHAKTQSINNMAFAATEAGSVTECALLRLRRLIDEAKSLCLFLRTSGCQGEVDRIFGELDTVVRAPLSLPSRGMLNVPYAGGAGGGRGDAAALGGEEAAPASGVESQGSPGMNWNSGMDGFRRNAEENTRMPNFEKGLGNAAAESSNATQNGFNKEERGKEEGMMGLGSAPDVEAEDAVDQLLVQPRNAAWTNNTEAKPSSEGLTFAFVEFKRGRIRRYYSEPDIAPGRYVMVDGDRGQDCGLLVQTIRKVPGEDDQIVCMEGTVVDEKSRLEEGRVIRPASMEEVKRLHTVIANAEAVALKTCRERCYELNIKIDLVDVEYQFDMNKVSFFFDCDHSVDFRILVRELYRSFGARIWMENINPNVRNSMQNAVPNRSNSNHYHGENVHYAAKKKKKKTAE